MSLEPTDWSGKEEAPEPADQPKRGSDVDYCSDAADNDHYWAYCKTAGDETRAALWYRRCQACGFVDLSELAARMASYQRMAGQINMIGAAFQQLTPVLQQVLAPLVSMLGQIVEDAKESKGISG